MTRLPGADAGRSEGFDTATGFVLAPRLAMRLRDALANQATPIVVGCCRISNWSALSSTNAGHALMLLHRVGDALRSALPFHHTLARIGPGELCFLLPNAGTDPDALAKRVASDVARRIGNDPSSQIAPGVEVAFGHSVAPRDSADTAALLSAARTPRMRLRRPA